MAKEKYEPDFALFAEEYAREGLNDKQIAEKLGISKDTYYTYQKKYPDFLESIKRGKKPVDIKVENSLLKRALGYEYEEKTTEIRIGTDGEPKPAVVKTIKKQVAPDVGACCFWLKNRKGYQWKDKHSTDITSGDEPIKINVNIKGVEY